MEQLNHSTHNKTQSSKMSNASSSASDYEQYIKQYYIKKGDPSSAGQSFTHTRIPSQERFVFQQKNYLNFGRNIQNM